MLNIDMDSLKLFIKDKVGVKMDKREALDLGLQKEFAEADVDTNDLEIDDILECDDLLAKFATLQQAENDKKQDT